VILELLTGNSSPAQPSAALGFFASGGHKNARESGLMIKMEALVVAAVPWAG
jgi:hypothetical protein